MQKEKRTNGEVSNIKKEDLLDIRCKGPRHPVITGVKFWMGLLGVSSPPQTLICISLGVS